MYIYKKQLFAPSAKISKQVLLYNLQREQQSLFFSNYSLKNSFQTSLLSFMDSFQATSVDSKDVSVVVSSDEELALEKEYVDTFFTAS